MDQTANVRRTAALTELAAALRRHTASVEERLQATGRALQALLEAQQGRVHAAYRRLQQARLDLEAAQAALRRCEESAEHDHSGGWRDCRDEAERVREAHARCRAAEEVLAAARRLLAEMEQAAATYQHAAAGLRRAAIDGGAQAAAYLNRAVDRLEAYNSVPLPTASPGSSVVAPESARPTWSEQQAILHRMMAGDPITVDELHVLGQPASDLQTATLQDQSSWAQSLEDAEEFLAAMRDSHEASDIFDAVANALQFQRINRRKDLP